MAVLTTLGIGCTTALGFVAPVTAGPPKRPPLAHLDFDGYFPSTTQIHVGDSVSWQVNGFHTVTFLGAGEKLPPLIITAASAPLASTRDALGNPYWWAGQPTQIINPKAGAPAGGRTYNGTGFLSSGLPGQGPPKAFVVKFTKAGTFNFHCVVHPNMAGTVKVLPKGKPIPSAKQDRKRAERQLKAGVAKARKLAKVSPGTATVLAGNDRGSVTWLRFFPEHLTIKAGTTVEFKIQAPNEVHTITFGPESVTGPIERTFTAPLPGAGAGPPTIGVNPLGGYPSDPPPLPPYTGSNHGTGYENSGILSLGGGPLPSSAKITFTKPGTYSFECVIHENMDGKITVTP